MARVVGLEGAAGVAPCPQRGERGTDDERDQRADEEWASLDRGASSRMGVLLTRLTEQSERTSL